MAFLEDLAQAGISAINEQYAPGNLTPTSLDTIDPNDPDRVINFGKLGDFAKKIDNTAQRTYVENGFIRNVRPRAMEILMQEPDLTVIVKKRAFASLVDNYRLDKMDSGDKLFYRATKNLFQNKCRAISVYEKLSKIEKIVKNKGVLDDYMVPLITDGIEALEAFSGKQIVDANTKATFITLRKLQNLSDPATTTTWNVISNSPFYSDLGEGTGTFDLTMVASIDTTVSTEFGQGSASLNIEDPYNLMYVNRDDIEKAISDASSFFNSQNFSRVSERQLRDIIDQDKQRLNSIRFSRGAPGIRFSLNEASIINQKIRAFIDEVGREILFTYDPGILGIGATADIDASAFMGIGGLNVEETDIFKTIIVNMLQVINQAEDINQNILRNNTTSDIRYVREKMILNYSGKSIIQPMDVINVFISTKTSPDNKIVGFDQSSATASTFFNKINNLTENMVNTFNSAATFFGGRANSSVDDEKKSIVGSDFPTWLWVLLRNDFTRQAAGTQVFQGVVTGVSSNYSASSGKYTLSVQAKDNAYYFNLGQVNLKPSLAVGTNELYNPITPFELDFDPSNGLLTGENLTPNFLEENNKLALSGAIKFKSGRYRGFPAYPNMYLSKDGERVSAQAPFDFRYVLNDPDGFVYRWKSGIGSYTYSDEANNAKVLNSDRSPLLTKDPFAGQDVMNVLSLLVTGQPYNYNNFVKAGLNIGNLTRDDILGESGSTSYFRGLSSDLNRNNAVWGNFIPFKEQVLNEKALAFTLMGQYDVSKLNSEINKLLDERAAFFDSIITSPQGSQFAKNPNPYNVDIQGDGSTPSGPLSPDIAAAVLNIRQIDVKVDQLINDSFNKVKNSNLSDGSFRIFGDDALFDSSASNLGGDITGQEQREALKNLRSKINYLTQRRLWKVKSNDDQNLFIVDDQYDKNYDIQNFESSFSKDAMSLLNSEYTDPFDKIITVARPLGLEVFADSQGHIRARPPAYNKVPSSVFRDLVKESQRTGKRIFPRALERLFINNADGLVDKLETTEDQIRLRVIAIGYTDDLEIEDFLTKGDSGMNSGGTYTFKFISDGETGQIGSTDFRNVVEQAFPEIREGLEFKPLVSNDIQTRDPNATATISRLTNRVNNQTRLTGLFTIKNKFTALKNPIAYQDIDSFNTSPAGIENTSSSSSVTKSYQTVRNRLQRRKGTKEPELNQLFPNRSIGTRQTEYLKVLNDLSRLLSERQGLVKTLSNSLKNLNEALAINGDPKTKRKSLLTTEELPEVIAHMIEDESFDDFGQGSGGRYIIKDNQILSLSIDETPPEFTSVQVRGLFNEFIPNIAANGLELRDGGNGINTAYAVDYDMWRMYGFKQSQPVVINALSNPQTQLAPFAVYLLNRARRNIFKGSVIITGNEFMQAGEVIYIESKDLLFYVEEVRHSFSYSGNYTTTLKLTYGHNPGEYIPTHLDIIGKTLYSKSYSANLLRHVRSDPANGDRDITVLVIDNNSNPDNVSKDTMSAISGSSLSQLINGSYGEQNRKNLVKVIMTLAGGFSPNSNKIPKIQLRIYYNSNAGIDPSSNLFAVAGEVKAWMANPQKSIGKGDQLITAEELPPTFNVGQSQIEVLAVDRSDPQSPSSGAWSIARSLVKNGSINSGGIGNDCVLDEELKLFNNIIDIWVTYEDIESQLSTSATNNPITSQQAYDNARNLSSTLKA